MVSTGRIPQSLTITNTIRLSIEICNLQGEVLFKSQNAAIDLSGMADGIYLVRIYSPDGMLLKAQKIIMQ
jgi:hypothetical protein